MKNSSQKDNTFLNLRHITIGLALLLLSFTAGIRFHAYLQKDVSASEALDAATAEETALIWVDVKGAVVAPGVYQFPAGSRVEDALALVGLSADAAPELLNRAACLYDGSELVVSYRDGDIDWNALAEQRSGAYYLNQGNGEFFDGEGDTLPPGQLININTASAAELARLQGIGTTKAAAIVEYREIHGAFVTKEQIMNVSGIGEATLEKINAQICI